MNFTGRITKLTPKIGGISKRTGKTWEKQDFVVQELSQQYPQALVVSAFNDRVTALAQFKEGDVVSVNVNFSVNQWMDKNGATHYVQNINLYSIDGVQTQQGAPQAVPQAAPISDNVPF